MASNKPEAGRETISSMKAIDEPTDISFPSCRLVLSVLAFFSFFVMYSARVNLSVALVAMVNTTYIREMESASAANKSDPEEVPCPGENAHKNKTDSGDFNWSAQQQGIILGAFFYGYIVTQIPGSILTQRFGGKIILQCGVFWTSLLTLLTPILTTYGKFGAIVALRIMEGIGEGGNVPAMHFMISKWSPPLARSKMVTFVYAGSQIGTVFGMPISGLLCEYAHWTYAFYLFGSIGMLWSILWFFLVYNSPATHPWISPQERNYIEMSQGLQAQGKGSLNVPWGQIFKSPPVYAVAVAHFTNNWGYYTLLTCLPQYLKYILKFDIRDSGVLSGLPYLTLWVVMIASGYCADAIRERHILSTTMVRKVFNAIGFLGPGACLVATGYISCNTPLAVGTIVLGIGLTGISWAGWSVNHLDLAPPYAGILMGLTNAIATIPGFAGPAIVGVLTYQNHTQAAWRKVFYISGAIYLFGSIFFFIFGSGKRQNWSTERRSSARVRSVVSEPVVSEPVVSEPLMMEPAKEPVVKETEEGVEVTERASDEGRKSGEEEEEEEEEELEEKGPLDKIADVLNMFTFTNEDVKFGM